MMKVNYKDYNVINSSDDNILGFYEDIVKYFKDTANEFVNEDLPIGNITDILELLKELREFYDRGELYENSFLEIGYNPMGAYTWCEWFREKERNDR